MTTPCSKLSAQTELPAARLPSARKALLLPVSLALVLAACAGALALAACGDEATTPATDLDAGVVADAGDAGTDASSDAEADAGCGELLECDGVCVEAASCDFSVTSLEPAMGPMNGGNFVTLHGHGFAQGMRVDLADGRAVVRVVDSETALVQPPPGPHQTVDVKVTLADASAVLPAGYRYVSGVLGTSWEKKQMATPRGAYPGLALLQDGRMLVVGGAADATLTALATAELYDPETGQVSAAANAMGVGRIEPATVTLMTGQALVVGNWAVPTSAVDRFDPDTNEFVASTATTVTARSASIAVLLVDGRVLVMSRETPSAEIYDPDTDSFSAVAGAPEITDQYDQPWPVRLRDGRVLVVKGSGRPCFFFDSDTDTFTTAPTGPEMVVYPGSPREGGVVLAADGRVFVIGGVVDPLYTPVSTIEVFDPTTTTGFQPLAQHLAEVREAPGTTLLADGEIIAIGGNTIPSLPGRSCQDTFEVTSTVDIINPGDDSVTAFASLPEPNWTLSAATLRDGSLIAAGGLTCGGAVSYPYLYFLQGTIVY